MYYVRYMYLILFPFFFSIANRKPVKSRSVGESNRYKHLDNLKDVLLQKEEYEIVELSDELMGINVESMPDRNLRNKAREAFVASIEFSFPVGVFTFHRFGTLGKWTAVFRMGMGHDDKHHDFIGACIDATKNAPTYLSRRQTNDAIDTIARASGKNKRLCKSMVHAVLPDGCIPDFASPKEETEFIQFVTNYILCVDSEEEKELITDFRTFNVRGNTDVSRFSLFWEYCARALDLENGSGAHHRRHAAADEETTTNVSYAPGILSIPQLIKATVDLLEKDGKEKGKDYHVPSEQWVYMQFSPNNEYASTACNYSGTLPYIRKIISRSLRDGTHPFAHWVSGKLLYAKVLTHKL